MGIRAGWTAVVVTLLTPIAGAAQAPPVPAPGQPPLSVDSTQAAMQAPMQDRMQSMMERMQAMQEMMQGMHQMMQSMQGQHGGHAHAGAQPGTVGAGGTQAHSAMGGCMQMAPQAPAPDSAQGETTTPAPDHNH